MIKHRFMPNNSTSIDHDVYVNCCKCKYRITNQEYTHSDLIQPLWMPYCDDCKPTERQFLDDNGLDSTDLQCILM